jgi:predicted aspartyl protease
MNAMMISHPAFFMLISFVSTLFAFHIHPNVHKLHRQRHHRRKLSTEHSEGTPQLIGIVAPLKYVGPYACLQLDFPHLLGTSLTFLLDTGANVNAISKHVADKLDLPVVMKKEDLSILASAGAGGSFQPGDFVMLGDCQLGDMPKDQPNITFMTNLTAAAIDLGVANMFSNGLLGSSFFECFPAGVEFDFHGTDGDPPTIIFYYGQSLPDWAKNNSLCIPIGEYWCGVPTIIVIVNGINITAIIDTGSPITILSPNAAREVGVETAISNKHIPVKTRGIDDATVNLSPSKNGAPISIGNISLGNIETVCIGDLPGLSLAGKLSDSDCPQMLLGLDALRRTYRMILRLPHNEVWFEEMPVGA